MDVGVACCLAVEPNLLSKQQSLRPLFGEKASVQGVKTECVLSRAAVQHTQASSSSLCTSSKYSTGRSVRKPAECLCYPIGKG